MGAGSRADDMSDFVAYLQDLFCEFGDVRSRKMFGGYGLYHEGIMFALVADDTLFLKVDPNTAESFKSRGLPQFSYRKGSNNVNLSYYMAPTEALDDPAEMRQWATLAFESARRQKKS